MAEDPSKLKKVCIGDKVLLENNMKGEVRFLGNVSGKNGIYYGIKLNEPKGKNNGGIKGIRYFYCAQDYGLFVARSKIKRSKVAINEEYKNLPRVIPGDKVIISTKNIEGIIRFIGTTDFKLNEILYGVELEEPSGKHSGIVGDREYFQCKNECGEFVNGDQVIPALKRKAKKRKSSKKNKTKKSSFKGQQEKQEKQQKHDENQKSELKINANSATIKKKKDTSTPRNTSTPRKKLKPSSPQKRRGSPRKKKAFKSKHNRHPSYIPLMNRYQTETNRKRSLLLVYGYCHLIQTEELSTFFDVFYYAEKEKNMYFDYNGNGNNNNNNNNKYGVISISIIDLCHSYLYEKINIDDFKQLSLIGKGGFAEVRKVSYKHSNDDKQYYAMKSLSKRFMLKKKQEKQIFIERDILINLNHWLIINLFWSFQDTKYLHLIEEFCEGGDLMKILMNDEILNDQHTRFYIAEIAEVINFLHEMQYVHRDIKPDNILLHNSGHIKLCDFGSAAYYDPQEYDNEVVPRHSRKNKKLLYRIVGTPDYVAPEILSKKGYGFECDWWGVGVIMFECLCGYPPFYAASPKQTCRNIINYSKTLHIPCDADVSSNASDCILKLLCSWQSRMNFKKLQKHSFFKGIDWNNLEMMIPPHPINGLGILPDIDEMGYESQLHYTRSGGSMGFGSGSLPPPLKRRKSKHSRNHFKGFTFEHDNDNNDNNDNNDETGYDVKQ